ncbi:MAG: DUF3034 family protein [bacterium]
MKSIEKVGRGFAAGIVATVLVATAQAGVPLNSLQGAGGVAFNPLAYPSGQNKDPKQAEQSVLSKPQFGAWYVNLSDVDVDWTAIGVSETLFDRLEMSYGYEVVAPPAENIKKQNLGAKLLLVPENAGGTAFVPAVSVGTIWKSTDNVAAGSDDSAYDFYGVATKLITQLPRPVLISGGVLSTKEQVTGVFGYNADRDTTFFGNIDVIPLSYLAVGLEYKQGAKYSSFKNASYWDAHAAWFANPNLTLVAAYVSAGDETSKSEVGLGDGVVLSAQYAF